MRCKLLLAWYRLGMKWTERACRLHGGDHYADGYPALLRALGWD